MDWAPRIKVARLRQLYRGQARGRLSERVLLDVGWGLHALSENVVAAATALHWGEIPCPNCGAAVQRRGIPPPTAGQREALLHGRGYAYGWFHCEHCQARLLWSDCRDALRQKPRCFDCLQPLRRGSAKLFCPCGTSWTFRQYRESLTRRKWLPCAQCGQRIRRPPPRPHRPDPGMRYEREAAQLCSRCGGVARRSGRHLICSACGYTILWRSRKLLLKRRDELFHCDGCGHEFRWREWRRKALHYSTGNPGAAAQFLTGWESSATPEQQMMHIDVLVQALHGRGALAPVFIEGTEKAIRALLDELAGAS